MKLSGGRVEVEGQLNPVLQVDVKLELVQVD